MKVTPKKRLGQHFLKDEDIALKTVNALAAGNKNVLEIGAGMGVLTKYLLNNENINLKVVEIDEESVEYLTAHYPQLGDNLLAADFLTLELDKVFQGKMSIIGNFPYNISSQIIFKMLDYKEIVTEMVGMFQKEVAERLAAAPGSKSYGITSVLLQAFYDIEYLFTVDESKFLPPPKVKSAVIRIEKNEDKKLNCDYTLFRKVVKTAFNQRRKTLRNSLKSFTFDEKRLPDELFSLRPEQLSVQQFESICNAVLR